MKRHIGRICLWVHYRLDPAAIDWMYFVVGWEAGTEWLGMFSGWLHDIGVAWGN